jgi:thiol-disulfide isomerase/thioredoxin
MRSVILASILSVFVVMVSVSASLAALRSFEIYEKPVKLEAAGFYNAAGERVALSDFADKPVMLNVWATWCGSCVAEMPDMMALHEANSDKYHFLAVSIDKDGFDTLTPFLAEKGWQNLDVYHDKGKPLFSALQIKGTPTTIMLNRQGEITARIEGDPKWDDVLLSKLLTSAE